ncbi:MAG: MerR family transcriptional regulator [Oscillospiraceae bacterium]|nr:MerR family transcriptional regulator [Oscillospiraceae bacterium]
MKQYRIGDFAKYLGVTPDFLKHYEELGIIQSERSESGYRFYSFRTTMMLIECIRMRNYGMTLREIREAVSLHKVANEQFDRRINENIEHMKDEILLDEALAAEYQNFLEWKAPLADRDSDWEIRWGSPMLFLPHADRDDFIHDERIYSLIRDWMSFIPIVKSCMKMEENGQITWGFIVREQDLLKLRIPVNDIVERIPACKLFYYKFKGQLVPVIDRASELNEHPALQQMHALNLQREATIFRTTLMPVDWQQNIGIQYGYYAVPIRT